MLKCSQRLSKVVFSLLIGLLSTIHILTGLSESYSPPLNLCLTLGRPLAQGVSITPWWFSL